MKNNDVYNMSSVKQSVISAVMVSLCVVLPLAFHSIPKAGEIYCPIHIPVIICGMVCSWQYALACAVLGPVMSCVIAAMPSVVDLPAMIVELVAYAVITSLLMKFIKTGKLYFDIYTSLVVAMITGRVLAGVVKALIFARGGVTVSSWAIAYFVTSLPAIIIQLIFIPAIYTALERSGLIPSRYIIDDFDKE